MGQGLAHYQMGLLFNIPRLINLGKYLIQDALRYQINTYEDSTKPGTDFFSASDNFPYLCYARSLDYLKEAPLRYGYFSEAGGSDSSYNGVCALQLGRIFCAIPNTDLVFKKQVWEAFVRCVRWEVSRILPSGEISLEDNTRVAESGESFNGKPKQVNYIECLPPLNIYAVLAGDYDLRLSATDRMLRYYTVKILKPQSMTFYAKGLEKIQSGNIDLASDNFRVALVQLTKLGAYEVNLSTDEFYSDIPLSSQPDVPEFILNTSFDGTVFPGEEVFFDTVPPLPTNPTYQISGIVIYKDTGDAATSPLVAFSDNVDGLPWGSRLSDASVNWSDLGYIFSLET